MGASPVRAAAVAAMQAPAPAPTAAATTGRRPSCHSGNAIALDTPKATAQDRPVATIHDALCRSV